MEYHLDGCRLCIANVEEMMPPMPGVLADVVRGLDRSVPTAGGYWRQWANPQNGSEATGDGRKPFEKTGDYESLAKLGSGGNGDVYKARELGLGREVAVKILPARVRATPSAVARLKQEANRLAKLEHPNIVRLYTADEYDGVPFFTMELLPGATLSALLRASPPTPRRSAEIVKVIAEAVYFAHTQGIFHLDLKPGNILLTADGVPKVGDFGLSRVIDSDLGYPRGTVAGTDEYMAPEQWVGDPSSLREPTDIYGLGAILFELLYGRPPFNRSAERTETRRRVLFDEPAFPKKHAGIPRDLNKICMRCLRKRPDERYASARELAEALGRYLQGYPVERCGWPRQGLYFVHRRKAVVGGVWAAVLAVSLTSGMFFSGLWKQRLNDAQNRFEVGRQWAGEGRVGDGLVLMQEALDHLPIGERLWRNHFSLSLAACESRLSRELAYLHHPVRITAAAGSPNSQHLLIGDEAGTLTLWDWKNRTTRSLEKHGSRRIYAVAFDQTGAFCAAGGEDSAATVREVRSGKVITTCHLNYFLRSIVLLENGKFLVTGTGDLSNPLRRWELTGGVATEVPIHPLGDPLGQIVELVGSPGGDRFVSVSFPGRCLLWNSKSGDCLADITANLGASGHAKRMRTAFSADGSRLAVADSVITLHDGRTGELYRTIDAGNWKELYAFGFQNEGGLTLVADTGRATVIRRGTFGNECWDDYPIDGTGHVAEVALSAACDLLVTGLNTKSVRVAKPPTPERHFADLGDLELGSARVAVSGNSSTVATLIRPTWNSRQRVASAGSPPKPAGFRSRLQLWEGHSLQALGKPVDFPGPRVAQSMAISRSGDRIALGCLGTTAQNGRAEVLIASRLDVQTMNLHTLGMHESDVMAVAFTSDGKSLVTGSAFIPDTIPGELICWSLEDWRPVWRVAFPAGIVAVEPSPRGDVVAIATSDGSVRVLNLDRPHVEPAVLEIGGAISGLTFSSDGGRLAAATVSGRVLVFEWSGDVLVKRAQFDQRGSTLSSLVFGPGDRILYARGINEIHRWDSTVWKPIEPTLAFPGKLLAFDLIDSPAFILAVTKNGVLVRSDAGPWR